MTQPESDLPKITAKQRAEALRAVRLALEAVYPKPAAAAFLDGVLGAFESIPTSRACQFCDMFTGSWCRQWRDDVPQKVQDQGCDKFQDDGVPF